MSSNLFVEIDRAIQKLGSLDEVASTDTAKMNTYNQFLRCSVTKSGFDRLPSQLLSLYSRCLPSRCRARPFQSLQLSPRYRERTTQRGGVLRPEPSLNGSPRSELFQQSSRIRSFHHSPRCCGERVNTPLAPRSKIQCEHPVWFRETMPNYWSKLPNIRHASKEEKADMDARIKRATPLLKSWGFYLCIAFGGLLFLLYNAYVKAKKQMRLRRHRELKARIEPPI